MARRADIVVANTVAVQWSGAGTNYIIQTPGGVLYMVYVDSLSDVVFKKSSDGGLTWTNSTVIHAGTASQLAVWYDRWSGLSTDNILVAYTDSGDDDTRFRSIDTASSDALSTAVVVFLGASAVAGGHISITRSVSGNVYIKALIDAGAEGDFFRLTNANFPNGAWDNRAVDEAIATLDQMILLPDFGAADPDDCMAVFWDASANQVSMKTYDNSGDAWGETALSGTMTELSTATAFASFAIGIWPDTAVVTLAAWSATDAANADLRYWDISSPASAVEATNVVLNSTDDQGLCAVSLAPPTGSADYDIYVFYGGISSGGETWNTSMHLYYKVSTDFGSTWGPETLLDVGQLFTLRQLFSCPRVYSGPAVAAWVIDGAQNDALKISVDRTAPRATSLVGIM
jgi:hypothetical protein